MDGHFLSAIVTNSLKGKMTSVGVVFIALASGIYWLETVEARMDRCLSAHHHHQYAVSFFGDHSDWRHGISEEVGEENKDVMFFPHHQCVRVRGRKIQEENFIDSHHGQRDDMSKDNNIHQQKPIKKYKGSKRKRKKEKKKRFRKRKSKQENLTVKRKGR